VPALDGLRGACLAAVLLFHSGYAWMPGGFLGVSTFFTLSGYLITGLLLQERASRGGIGIARFWARRLRRLLPAALLTVAAVLVLGPHWLPAGQRERLTGDAFATLAYLVNWRFMSPEYAYNLIFVDPSPLQHFWSLAIEGQFYLVFPLLVAAVLRFGGGTRALAATCVLLTLASVADCLTGPSLPRAEHRLYYGTDARAAELVIGALLALIERARGVFARAPLARLLPGAGAVAALLLVVAWCTSSVSDLWLYRGGFAAYAATSAVVIAAATLADGPVATLLSARWLRWIGKVSYGAYLFHWPLFLFLTPERTGLGALPLLAVRVAATLGLAGLSYRFFEMPIRRGTALPGRRFTWATATSLVLLSALAIEANPMVVVVGVLSAYHDVKEILAGRGLPPRHPRVAMFGDSTAFALWTGLGPWMRDEGRAVPVDGYATLGCGVFTFGEMQNRGRWAKESAECDGMVQRWQTAARDSKAEVAIVLIGPWEVRNRRRDASSPALKLGDPELDHATRKAIADATDALLATGARVVWLTSPHIKLGPINGRTFSTDGTDSEPQRIDRLNALVADVARMHPDTVRLIDLGAYMRRRPNGEFDDSIRADNVHFSVAGALEISRDWLGPAILSAARDLHAGED
jgi:peptidoglycan/LPS O-acetylase OafA/YrhL